MGKKPRLVLSPSLSNSPDLVKVRPTLGCVKPPLSTHLTQLSELLWRKVPLPPTPNQLSLREILSLELTLCRYPHDCCCLLLLMKRFDDVFIFHYIIFHKL